MSKIPPRNAITALCLQLAPASTAWHFTCVRNPISSGVEVQACSFYQETAFRLRHFRSLPKCCKRPPFHSVSFTLGLHVDKRQPEMPNSVGHLRFAKPEPR